MSHIDHAAAHERIADLALEPGALAALDSSTDLGDVALREHLAACAACRAEVAAWSGLQAGLGEALGARGRAPDQSVIGWISPIMLPPGLRADVLVATRGVPAANAPQAAHGQDGREAESAPARAGWAPLRSLRVARGLATAGAVLVIIVAVAGALVIRDQDARLQQIAARERDLAELTAAVDRVLAAPHKVVTLARADGTAAGSVSWSRHDWVVLTGAIAEPPAGQRYKCWLEDPGRQVLVGEMDFAGGVAYWVGSLDAWATWEVGPETRFVVSLEAADATQRMGVPVLEALLAG